MQAPGITYHTKVIRILILFMFTLPTNKFIRCRIPFPIVHKSPISLMRLQKYGGARNRPLIPIL